MPELKELLGEELFNQVTTKAGDHKLAVVSDGQWFPKEKFDAVNNDNKDLKNQLKQRDIQLDELKVKAAGNEELTKQINDLKVANEKVTTEYQAKLDKQAFDFALDKALASNKAKNPKAVKALLNTDSIKLDGETLLGLDDQLKALKESDAYLFDDDSNQPPGLKGKPPHNPNPTPPGGYQGKNPFKAGSINLTEQARLYKENPELYKQLKAQA